MGEFRFCTSVKLVEITGRRAATLEELLSGIRESDGAVIFHHTHHFVLQHQYLVPEPPNQFAHWAGEALQEHDLAERLLAVNTVEFRSIRSLQDRLAETIEEHLKRKGQPRRAPPGMEFHFLRARNFTFPTPHAASDLRGFREALARVSLNSVYHHMFEARLRLERAANDFSSWLDQDQGEAVLAGAIARLDPYTYTLEDLRQAILQRVDVRLGPVQPAPAPSKQRIL
jgi:hypothetical protein